MRTQDILLNAYEEVEVIKNIFSSFVEKSKKENSTFPITFKKNTKNDSVEIIYKGHTLFAKFTKKYDDSIEGAYLEMGIIEGLSTRDVISNPEGVIPILSRKKYIYSEKEIGWREKDMLTILYSSKDIVEEWLNVFEEKFGRF